MYKDHHDALIRTLDKSNDIIGQCVHGEPAGFGGLVRFPCSDEVRGVLFISCLVDERSAVWAVDDVERRCVSRREFVLPVVIGGDEGFLEEELVEQRGGGNRGNRTAS
jgi:hypothetical protein